MIKRALGLWADAPNAGGGDVDDSDEELTPEERRKLERRMVPGTMKMKGSPKQTTQPAPAPPKNRKAGVVKDSDDESGSGDDDEEDGDEEASQEGGWASEDPSDEESDDADPDMLAPEKDKAPFRGAFHCQLCPDKILLNEKLLEAHLESAAHKKAERRLERAKALGVEAFEAECVARKEAREARKDGVKSKRDLKNASYWEKKREKLAKKSKQKAKGKEESAELSKEEIEERKRRFQAKKARRLELRQGADAAAVAFPKSAAPSNGKRKVEPVSETAAPASSAKPNRAERRAALQAAYAGKPASAESPAPATVSSEDRPRKKKKKKTEA